MKYSIETPDTMHAMVLEQFGADLVSRELPMPRPAPGEVLVRVEASGVNPLDTKIRSGQAAHARVTPPMVLGIDMAGTVVAVGPDVDRYAPGDEVYGMTGGVGQVAGSLAEYQIADQRLLALRPAGILASEAAALPLASITAWEGLVDRAAVRAGQRVLIHGGGGAVGHVAVQLAVARGAEVTATDTGQGLDRIRAAGAHAVDYRTTLVEDYVGEQTQGAGFDVVLDTVGGSTLDDSFGAVRRYTGHVVSILGWGTHSLAALSFRGATYSGVFTLLPLLTGKDQDHHGDILARVSALVDDGLIRPGAVDDTFRLDSVMRAHELVEQGSPAKVIVKIE